jgi:hypothetical protein
MHPAVVSPALQECAPAPGDPGAIDDQILFPNRRAFEPAFSGFGTRTNVMGGRRQPELSPVNLGKSV